MRDRFFLCAEYSFLCVAVAYKFNQRNFQKNQNVEFTELHVFHKYRI